MHNEIFERELSVPQSNWCFVHQQVKWTKFHTDAKGSMTPHCAGSTFNDGVCRKI